MAVAGPAAGLTAIVAARISSLGSFQAFLLAVLFAGLIQVLMGLARVGFIAAFFPTSVVKGLLAAVGIILILKQIPHLLGHDTDPEGEMSFQQVDAKNTITELGETVYDLHSGAILVGAACLLLLFLWDRVRWLRRSPSPPPRRRGRRSRTGGGSPTPSAEAGRLPATTSSRSRSRRPSPSWDGSSPPPTGAGSVIRGSTSPRSRWRWSPRWKGC